ncbi:MAG TPA: isoleucine--tRNA ligase [Planctomycetaceae bacterium]|nr:isoleucine--tRNA ligase [Planctomycetaceae bacterium]HRE98868.1 isoleucine--tRNA ligase [Pirellulaceae bacterium]
MFQPVKNSVDFPSLENEVLAFWRERRIYDRTLENREGAEDFVFFEGPPTANGMPHPGHCLTRAIKDLFPRYRTMRGYRCLRKAGWDTHGLPVEVEVCKELGIHSKEEIEAYGVEPFIRKCQASVWRYMQEWERLTERLGFWIHLDQAYVTYHRSFVESVWWSLKNLFDRGLLYRGHKIVWWWAQGGTALSSGEVGQGYREVADPSVYVRFPIVERPGTSLLVWTTTPWTLPSNQFAAVHPELEYATAVDAETGEKLILAAALVETVAAKAKRTLTVESTCRGADLIGLRYVPPFPFYYDRLGSKVGHLRREPSTAEPIAWRITAADFVTIDSGTGAVHEAPAFGEVDFELLQRERERFVDGEGPELICAVGPDGRFTDEAPPYRGEWVKGADRTIIRDLKESGRLFFQEQYLHEYPFCWRSDQDPLIQYPRESWFVRTTRFKDRMLANNRAIRWLPDHIQTGRFGNFLESNVDWALSRERYWGTPLPIWVCDATGKAEAIASYAELAAKPGAAGFEVWEQAKSADPAMPDDLQVHKPYIDAITYDSPFASGARMRRVPEVIDCWYDSGAMPFAQWGYPHAGRDRFESQFPADFISEAIDQTRGWFYSQLAISTMLFGPQDAEAVEAADRAASDTASAQSVSCDERSEHRDWPHPFRNCIVLGLMLAEWWESTDGKRRFLTEDEARAECGEKIVKKVGKMSKQLRNYRSPNEIFDTYGADALRWYFFAQQPPWNSIIYSDRAIKESIPEFLLRLWNVYSFFVIYAGIDRFDPAAGFSGDPGQLDPRSLAGGRGCRPIAERQELDRWILAELQRTVADVVARMDAYDNYGACQAITSLIDGLSNWYVRRSRDRFWSGAVDDPDKLDAYWTLYEVLTTVAKLVAPFVPFVAESIWRNLASVFGDRVPESVHLCDYPTADESLADPVLAQRMALLREIASLGRSARMEAKLKVRQPLSRVEVVLADATHRDWLIEHHDILETELNVRVVSYTDQPDRYITYKILPDLKRLGPRVGKLMPGVKKWLTEADGGRLLAELSSTGKVTTVIDGSTIELNGEDIQVRLQAKEGWAAAQGRATVVILSTELTEELILEGIARDLIRVIANRRKEMNLEFVQRIEVNIDTTDSRLLAAASKFFSQIKSEVLAIAIHVHPVQSIAVPDFETDNGAISIQVRPVGEIK